MGLPRFCGVCGLVSLSCPPNPSPPQTPCGGKKAGNPVDLFTGQELASTGGMSCAGLTPIDTGIKYNPIDAFGNRAGTIASFGFGWTFDYDISFLPFAGVQKRLVMPGGQLVNMVDDGSGKYRPVDRPEYSGAYAHDIGAGKWEIVLGSGAKWQFEPFPGITGVIRGGPPLFLTKVTDPNGNATSITRLEQRADQDPRRRRWSGDELQLRWQRVCFRHYGSHRPRATLRIHAIAQGAQDHRCPESRHGIHLPRSAQIHQLVFQLRAARQRGHLHAEHGDASNGLRG